ncbi:MULTISPECIES: exopolyphosphatase [unclassified Adlercreutzia]|uniref:Ppx/GppA phosphatase family protein n=1 Tax=unclassified Adlercreutzia TaxID=2636013 RepID=UPI0013EB86CA|nr:MULTISPECIES: exopolyphosphatase [unclassified Adlercreutzia]
MAYYGVIDLGSNSIRLVVYEVAGNARKPFSKKDFHSVINEKKIAGLSAYVSDGVFTQAGIDRAVEVLTEHLRRARNVGCDRVRVFATAVLRNCTNSKAATRAISDAIGLPVELLSARDEAHLGFVGATCDRAIERGTLIDIGGGSTELTRVEGGADSCGVSLPQGSVSSYAQFVDMILPTHDEMHVIEDAFAAHLDTLGDLEPYRAARLYGVGGSTRAAAKMYAAAFGTSGRPRVLELHQLDALLALLARNPHTFAHLAVKATPDRLHTLVPGCLIAITLMRALGAESLEICKYGVREGFLIRRILEA